MSERLGRRRRVCALLAMAGLVAAVHADDTRTTVKPAAPPGATPAKTTATAAAAKAAGTGKPAATTKPASAAKPAAPAADDELLEFLGGVDSEAGGQDWIDYLSQTDIARVAKGKKDD